MPGERVERLQMPISIGKRFRMDARSLSVIAPILIFSLVSLWTLPSCQTAPPSVRRPSWNVVTPVEVKLTKETEMSETLQKLCRILSSAPLTAQEAATSLGTIVEDKGKDSPLLVRPSDPSLREAVVVRQLGTEEPAYVELVLAEPGSLSVKTLSAAFGNYSVPPKLHWNSPTKLIFYVDIPNLPHTCAVIAEVRPGKQGVEDGIVTAVTVRRDVSLE